MRRLSLPAGRKGSPPRAGTPHVGVGRGQPRMGVGRGQPRRRAQPIWRAPWLLGGVAMVIFAAALTASWWGWRSGLFHRTIETARWELIARSADFGFRVQDIQVIGRDRTHGSAILDAVRIAEGAPILAFDADGARRRIEALPWVRSAVVERRLPDTIFLNLIERQPVAIWQHEGRFQLVDGEGTIIPETAVDSRH